ncbi:hypothetical protein BW727_100273 [Jeotgalibaca dankookensis]|uniref:Uncharacterized protein n=1 Tax=Jeotgalibaca dankookensis TaxID=708126 RepID=A0A1S6IMF8_9LACT|nr:hypothetical protein [Jeotgalibaca dankookensis]AQS52681.1 hypothetical protein BW727_100273 [Jeotgalibaca dankookensis]
MYTNAFMGMEFMEEGNIVVQHFLYSDYLAEEYVFESAREATHFYMACIGFCEKIVDFPPTIQERQFRKFILDEFGYMNYQVNIY